MYINWGGSGGEWVIKLTDGGEAADWHPGVSSIWRPPGRERAREREMHFQNDNVTKVSSQLPMMVMYVGQKEEEDFRNPAD